MKRRRLLAAGAGALSLGVGGCLDGIGVDGADGADEPANQNDTTTDPPTRHDLFVENHTESTETARLTLTSEGDGTIVDGRYELPDGRGIEFDDVADWDGTYTIDLDVDGEATRTFDWKTPHCGSGTPGDGGSRNAAVRLQNSEEESVDERATLVVDNCDEIHSPSVAVGPADSFRLDD